MTVPYTYIAAELERNRDVLMHLLRNIPPAQQQWKPQPEKWCLLEVVCHLYDEEREDFRARVQHILETPGEFMPPIDPPGWVVARQYMQQDYDKKLDDLLAERERSVQWLRSLEDAPWQQAYMHPKLGAMTAAMILANWLAHDLLHIRQVVRLKHQYLAYSSGQDLGYAGEW